MERMCRKQQLTEQLTDGSEIVCEVIPMGHDVAICISGGQLPHIGSVVMAIARPSLTGEGIGVTSSVLNGIGHKDEYVARKFAEAMAKQKECTAVCSCGIHIDGITKKQLEEVTVCCDRLLNKILELHSIE